MPAGPRLAAILVAAVVLVAVAILVLRASGAPIAQGPVVSDSTGPSSSASADASPSATGSEGSTGSASASPASEDETIAELREIEEQVIAIRGLEAADIGPPDLITRAELADELEAIFEEQVTPEQQERDNRALRAFGLLEPGQDALALRLELLGESVRGFYRFSDMRMVVVTDGGLDTEARITYAHEYTHALQDAAFDIEPLLADEQGADDRQLARTALTEGDATITMLAWMFQHLDQADIAEYLGSAEVPDTTGIPSWMVSQLAFPYDAGLTWTSSLVGADPFSPDFTEIDAAYADPPESTEQIIDLEAWEEREAPVAVEVPDLAAALGSGWEEVDATPVGQASIAIFLEFFGVGAQDADAAAEGWGGDRAVVASGPDDAFALAWRLQFDGATDADEFVEAYESVVDTLDFPASVSVLPDGDVLVVHASTDELLVETAAAAS